MWARPPWSARLSDISPLTTEAAMTTASIGIDDTSKVSTKTTTTVAMDFGRIAIDEDMVLFLFGTPGQDRFGFMWDDLIVGALGAVVLVDLRRIDDCFPAIDYFELVEHALRRRHQPLRRQRVARRDRGARSVDLDPEHPIVLCDARYKESVKGGCCRSSSCCSPSSPAVASPTAAGCSPSYWLESLGRSRRRTSWEFWR